MTLTSKASAVCAVWFATLLLVCACDMQRNAPRNDASQTVKPGSQVGCESPPDSTPEPEPIASESASAIALPPGVVVP